MATFSCRPLCSRRACLALVFVLAFVATPTQAGLLEDVLQWLFRLFGRAQSGPAQFGPYPVSKVDYHLPRVLDASYPWAVVVVPAQVLSPGNTERFPLVVFSHGDGSGGFLTYWANMAILNGLASFGFIVVAPASCDEGCDEGGHETYHQEQLNLIEWASEESRDEDIFNILESVDRENGYGVYGHSRGAMAIVTASPKFKDYNVNAAVLLQACGIEPLDVYESNAPLAVFTGSEDKACRGDTYYEQASSPKAFASVVGADHYEPCCYNMSPRYNAYIAAWFKIWIGQNSEDPDHFYELIYGDEQSSLCGGNIPMEDDCEALEE